MKSSILQVLSAEKYFLQELLAKKKKKDLDENVVPVRAAGIKGAANVEVDWLQLERPILVQGQDLVMNNHNCDIDNDDDDDYYDDKIDG